MRQGSSQINVDLTICFPKIFTSQRSGLLSLVYDRYLENATVVLAGALSRPARTALLTDQIYCCSLIQLRGSEHSPP